MAKIRLTSYQKVMSQNGWDDLKWPQRSRIKKELAKELGIIFRTECKSCGVDPSSFYNGCILTYFTYRKRRIRDWKNFMGGLKPWDDALVRAKIIKDDDEKTIIEGEHEQFIDGKNERTVVCLETLESEAKHE
ncbi:MAG: hypothetical protein GY853_13515 [PVC group bacterium]|nr:hypothetical protein [PVC group bacterium]